MHLVHPTRRGCSRLCSLVYIAFSRWSTVGAKRPSNVPAEDNDLHAIHNLSDALLQDTQGLIWRLHAVAQRLPADDPVRAEMDTVLASADQRLVETRNRLAYDRSVTQSS